MVAAVAVLAYPFAVLAAKIPVSPPAVSSAVGNTDYIGYPKLHDHLISFALLALCIGPAWLASRYMALPPPPLGREKKEVEKRVPVWLSRLVPLAMFVGLLILYLPALRVVLQQINQISFQPVDWDSANSLLWGYLVHQGYLPFRDCDDLPACVARRVRRLVPLSSGDRRDSVLCRPPGDSAHGVAQARAIRFPVGFCVLLRTYSVPIRRIRHAGAHSTGGLAQVQ